MNIIKPYFIIESQIDGESILKKIEKAGKTAYKSEDKITEDSSHKFIRMLIKRGHLSVIEHQSITVRVICDRGVTHEIVRHRLASYTQESTRYCDYSNGKFGNELTIIKPCFWKENDEKYIVWEKTIKDIEKAYKLLIKKGASPQEARSILPNSLKTEIVITMNLREWYHFFTLRTSEAAHPQMREMAIPLLKEFQNKIPIIFDDIHLNEIMVIQSSLLFSEKYFDGFLKYSEFDYESIILSNYEWMERRLAEFDNTFKQPIGYVIIVNSNLKQVFVYQRSHKKENYKEKRLLGKYSCGVGGHIEKLDIASPNPIHSSLLRELSEEIIISETISPQIIGFINDDNDDVGKVHFGIMYLIEINGTVDIPLDSEIKNGEFVSFKDFEQICNSPNYDVEGWSKIVLSPLKEYLNI